MKIELDGKVSIVTGSSRIGNAIATKLASAGSNLLIKGISDSEFLEMRRVGLESTESRNCLCWRHIKSIFCR